jgi:hypothetical protein
MDKIMSSRLDESVVMLVERLAHELNASKKHVLEEAIRQFATRAGSAAATDVLAQTSGAWRRDETPASAVTRARRAFREGMRRHH